MKTEKMRPSARDIVVVLLASTFGPKVAHAVSSFIGSICG